MKAKNTQEYCDYYNARREMESTHKKWMDTPKDAKSFLAIAQDKDSAMMAYRVAYAKYTGYGVI